MTFRLIFSAISSLYLVACGGDEATTNTAEVAAEPTVTEAVEQENSQIFNDPEPSEPPETIAEVVPELPTAFDITQVTCWELMTLPEDEAAYAFTLFYGYAAGADSQSLHVPDVAEFVIGKTVEECASKPDMTALSVFSATWTLNPDEG